MASDITGNQPQGGIVGAELGSLFRNLGTRPITVTSLEFYNDSGVNDVVLKVCQPDGSNAIKIRQAELDSGYSYIMKEERVIRVNEGIDAMASVADTIRWRMNFRVD